MSKVIFFSSNGIDIHSSSQVKGKKNKPGLCINESQLKKAILQNTFPYVKLQAVAYMHKVAAEASVTAHICKDI